MTLRYTVIFLLRMLLLLPLSAPAWAGNSIAVLDRRDLPMERSAAQTSHRLRLVLAYFDGDWRPEPIHSAVRRSARILAQCGVEIDRVELARLDAPAHYRVFGTQVSQTLVRILALPKPTIYFVADSRQQPAFDAEAIGRGNSATRPELRDTIWVARGARDLDIVLAHELAHLLMDSGEHPDTPGNLMYEYTTPQNTRLSAEQCARLRDTGTSHGLLQPVR